jgi:hypothetical protein
MKYVVCTAVCNQHVTVVRGLKICYLNANIVLYHALHVYANQDN